jgi:hypothetical protein
MRAIRRTSEIRDPARRLSPTTATLRTPADDFHDLTWLPLCTSAAAALETLLARPLSFDERVRIWKARSPLVLEILLKELAANPPPGAVRSLLLTLPSGLTRPDPTHWCTPTAPPPDPPPPAP